ncbi:hypothetical protein [Persephonella sp.]
MEQIRKKMVFKPLTKKEKEKFKELKKRHENILRKYKIRVGKNLDVLTEEYLDGAKKKERAILETYLYDFTIPADFKTTFHYIDTYFPDLIQKAKKINYINFMNTQQRSEIRNELKKWWFGFIQARMDEDKFLENGEKKERENTKAVA